MGKSLKYAIEPKTPETMANAKSQHQRFIETARELGCDEDEAVFEKRLGKIANAPPPAPAKKKPRRGARG